MHDRTQQATLAEIYAVLNQLVESYTQVMELFQSVVIKVGDIEEAVNGIREFVNNEYTDAVQGRDIWRHNAEEHRRQAERLATKLKTLEAVAVQIKAIAEHPPDPPSDFKVYVDNEVEHSHLMVVDESLDA